MLCGGFPLCGTSSVVDTGQALLHGEAGGDGIGLESPHCLQAAGHRAPQSLLNTHRPPQCSHGWAGWGRGSDTSQSVGGMVPGHGHLWLRPPAPVAWCVTGLFAVASAVLAHLAVTSEVCV